MLARRHIAAVLVAAFLAAAFPAGVLAQEDVPNLTPMPQAPSTQSTPEPDPERPSAGPRELPNTGADPRLLALAGAALLLTGGGLRMRTLDERF